mgnify:CR=1 FL=1
MNKDLLSVLKNTKDYISGEELSKIFNVSRAAIWKQINTLKNKGYIIEGQTNKGYKLISSPDLIDINEFNDELKTNFIGKNLFYVNKTESTNELAKKKAPSSPDGTVILSEIQSGGKGRLGRSFISPQGGIWTSIILKPSIEPIYASKFTQVAACALIKVLISMDIKALIKWPNDIYLNGKKICGILTEMNCDMDRINYLIIGVGINVNLSKEVFPNQIKSTATSLQIEENKSFNRSNILANFLNEFETLYTNAANNNDFSEVFKVCNNNSIIINKDVYLITSKGKEKIKCLGIDKDGALIAEDTNGNVKKIISGEITTHL